MHGSSVGAIHALNVCNAEENIRKICMTGKSRESDFTSQMPKNADKRKRAEISAGVEGRGVDYSQSPLTSNSRHKQLRLPSCDGGAKQQLSRLRPPPAVTSKQQMHHGGPKQLS